MLWLPNGLWNVIVTCCQPICYVWWTFNSFVSDHSYGCQVCWGRRGHDHMVVGFTTTYAISAYHHWYCGFDSCSGQGVQHYVIKFVSDLWQVSGFYGSSGFLHQYNCNIVESGIKHHKTKPNQLYSSSPLFVWGRLYAWGFSREKKRS